MSNLTAKNPKTDGVARGASGTGQIRSMGHCPNEDGKAIAPNVGNYNLVRGPATKNSRR